MLSFGPHLMLDFFTNSPNLNDIPFWEDLLRRLVSEIRMIPLSSPLVVQANCTNEEWNPPNATGLSGFIVLAESHVSFHTFVEARFVFLDVFSCKEFSESRLLGFLDDKLGVIRHTELDSQTVQRGANFPRR